MSFKEELPIWLNPGQKPPQPKIEEGYQPMDHPPADWFNWYQHSVYKALKEIQEIAATNQTVTNLNEKVDKHTALRNNPHGVTKTQVGLSNVDNVKQASKAEFDDHASNKENPHWVTKNQVGLGNVDNVRQASKAEFDDHKNNTSNPHSVTKAQVGLGNVDNVQQAPKKEFDDHKNSTSNPHSVTKAQVGLGSVPNWGGATQAEAQAGTNNAKIMTPLRTKEAIDVHGDDLKKHITILDTNVFSAETDAKDYPLGISYFFVDSNSQKFPAQHVFVTTIKEVLPGNQFRLFQTVKSVGVDYGRIWTRGTRSGAWGPWEEWETTDGAQQKVNVHEAKKNNPHNVTKAQVGLGNVDNAKQATKAEFDAHLNNKSNPHGVTKSQVGLGNVPNFPVSSQAQAEAGNHTESFMTPQRVRQFAAKYGPDYDEFNGIAAGLGSHTADKSNPHGVTKAQVGLGSVPNWGGATQAEAQAGTNNAKIMTPLRTKEAFNKFSTDQDTGWITLALHSYLQPQGTSPRVRRIGNTVYLEGTFKNVLDTDVLITVLPDEFRPGRSLTFSTTGQVGHGTVFVTRIDVQSNGRVIFIRSSRQWHGEYEPENWYNLDGIIYTV